ncbi:serine threonine- kinase 11-interacting isoform X1 [Pelobates cultripes]|uniref:Serine/threonine-protein kinase 11-interacting protein n=1 Tax=Pelobates cultripes TaxID=61616 RepID=A0AAD1SLJ8_PELCU|nr:serine threonine- kinase 11-interacting isoform X1 [Pelobates cultripes]
MPTRAEDSLIQALAHLLRNHGESVLNGSRVLTLLTPCLQVITRLIEQLFPRMPGSGFQALPSHPSDSPSVLQTQFLLDMFQKAPSLKLVHSADSPDQLDVTIFPFKSLKCLELRFLPPHCLYGLRSVYSRLEVLICFKCITTLQEVISLCAGDLTLALAWLELHTLNFSYNMICKLDGSLELLNSLKTLDLSHNHIKDCESYLKVLEELRYLNLGFNLLTSVPEISTAATATLQTLVLRHNQLATTSGLEHLTNLQHLDLSYNLLHDHKQLKGLTKLHSLRKLFLEGNPLYYHKDHQLLTVQYLSPRTLNKMFLDGYLMISLESMKAEDEIPNSTNSSPSPVELLDSCSGVETKASSLPRKKSKVKVRTASISEPSDNDCDRRRLKKQPVLQHQKVIERTESFRNQYGADWLQYRDHLERELNEDNPQIESLLPVSQSPLDAEPFFKNMETPVETKQTSPSPTQELPEPLVEVCQEPNNTDVTEVKLLDDDDDDDGFSWGDVAARAAEEDKYEIVDPLGPPVAVSPIQDGRPCYSDWPFIFFHLTRECFFEIALDRGQLLTKRHLSNLMDVKTSVIPWTWKDEVQEFPLITLFFDSVIEERKKAQYVVLDDSPDDSAKMLCDALRPIIEENKKEKERKEAAKPKPLYRCLKCYKIFGLEECNNAVNGKINGINKVRDSPPGSPSVVDTCPGCGSSYVIFSPPPEERSFVNSPRGAYPDREEQKSSPSEEETDSPGPCNGAESGVLNTLDRVRQALKRASFSSGNTLTGSSKSSSPSPPSSQSVHEVEQPWQLTPGSFQTLDFRLVDHRLKFHLDFEIIVEHQEEYQCCFKVPVVRFGKASHFCGLVVVSNQKIYFLEIRGEIRGSPCNWVKPGDVYSLDLFTHMQIGLNQQMLHLGFDGPDAAYTLLIGNRTYTTMFSQNILDTLSELPPRYLKSLVQIPEEVVTPQHRIWPLLCAQPGAETPPEFMYITVSFLKVDVVNLARDNLPDCDLAFGATLAQRESSAKPVSLLITHTHAYVLEDAHHWNPSPPAESNDLANCPESFRIKEKEPIVAVCAVHLFPSHPCHFHIRIHNERPGTETAWLLWTQDSQVPNEVAEFVRAPWEALFRVSYDKAINDNLNCCTPLPIQT